MKHRRPIQGPANDRFPTHIYAGVQGNGASGSRSTGLNEPFFRKLWCGFPTCGGVVYPACPRTWQSPGGVVRIFIAMAAHLAQRSGSERDPGHPGFVSWVGLALDGLNRQLTSQGLAPLISLSFAGFRTQREQNSRFSGHKRLTNSRDGSQWRQCVKKTKANTKAMPAVTRTIPLAGLDFSCGASPRQQKHKVDGPSSAAVLKSRTATPSLKC
jgi:hypothetical protein